MFSYLVAYVTTAIVFLALDIVWLGVVAKSFYFGRLGPLLAERISVAPALAFYAFYVIGVIVFCVAPGLSAGSWGRTVALGCLLGLIAYGTYDMTNLATLRGWPVSVALVDMVWGAVLTGLSAGAGYWAASWASRSIT